MARNGVHQKTPARHLLGAARHIVPCSCSASEVQCGWMCCSCCDWSASYELSSLQAERLVVHTSCRRERVLLLEPRRVSATLASGLDGPAPFAVQASKPVTASRSPDIAPTRKCSFRRANVTHGSGRAAAGRSDHEYSLAGHCGQRRSVSSSQYASIEVPRTYHTWSASNASEDGRVQGADTYRLQKAACTSPSNIPGDMTNVHL
jgi:hypothetical protein